MENRKKLEFLAETEIEVIVNVAPRTDVAMEKQVGYLLEDYIHYPFPDSDNFDRDEVFRVAEKAADYILEGYKVLVHCHAGRNRSSLISALIILLLYPDYDGKKAVWYMRKRRPNALANEHFVKFLEAFK